MAKLTQYADFEYRDLAVEASEDYLPEASKGNKIHEALLVTGFREILLKYVEADHEPFFEHPGDEYIIGSLIHISQDENLAVHTNMCTEIGISQKQALKSMSELIENLEAEYGKAAEEIPIGSVTPRSVTPPARLEDHAEQFTPGDGLFREQLYP